MPYSVSKDRLKSRPVRIVFILYWILLAYIFAALIFWFLTLARQNYQLTQFRLQTINVHDANFITKKNKIIADNKRKTRQYVGEGATFLFFIVTGAFFVFRLIRNHLRQSQQQQNFIMAITHELKTPIAVTKLNLETMQLRKLDESQQHKLITSTLQEANRLNTLCNNMLLLSQMDIAGYKLSKEKFDFSTLASDCADDFIDRFPNRKIKVDITEEIIFSGDQLLLQLAINNLLDNAIKYSSKEDVVLIKVFSENRKIFLQVADEGPGVKNEEREKIFEKYFRGNNRQIKGTGLGLYLSRQIVHQHGGKIVLKNNDPQGSIFEMQFKTLKNNS